MNEDAKGILTLGGGLVGYLCAMALVALLSGCGHASYSSDAGGVEATIMDFSTSAKTVSENNLRDAQADGIRTHNRLMEECVRYGRCYGYAGGGYYSTLGHTWNGVNSVNTWKGGANADAKTDAAMRAAKTSLTASKYTLETLKRLSEESEKALDNLGSEKSQEKEQP